MYKRQHQDVAEPEGKHQTLVQDVPELLGKVSPMHCLLKGESQSSCLREQLEKTDEKLDMLKNDVITLVQDVAEQKEVLSEVLKNSESLYVCLSLSLSLSLPIAMEHDRRRS